jgi:uncharacterized repeat protein (TIGR03803 family)
MRVYPYFKFSQKAKLSCWLCVIPLFFAAVQISPAQTFTTLASFQGPDGEFPSFIVQGSDGKIWGTTGGLNQYCGNVFKITTTGTFDVVRTFDCTVGSGPVGLLLGTDGSYYGYTLSGGSGDGGIIFNLTAANVLTVLYNFNLNGSSGSGPAGITQGTDGNFYGTTYGGGSALLGTIFKMTPSGNLTTLYQFDFTHGAQPYAGMIQGTDGNFYGTTYSGGSHAGGTVFRITPQGALTVLHNFSGGSSDGSSPVSALIEGRDGAFYGSTPYGGPDNDGTIFKITPSGTLTIVHSFIESDGRNPGPPVQAVDGNFYGATGYGGTSDANGTLYMMTPAGVVTTLHNFDGTDDGSNPYMLIQDTSGVLFGTTGGGGDLTCNPPYGCGTVFSLAMGLGPFVETLPAAGRVGTKVTILGTNLTGATGVTFNGTASSFQLISSSEITATVPGGATSGKVKVTKASGALASKSAFRILK